MVQKFVNWSRFVKVMIKQCFSNPQCTVAVWRAISTDIVLPCSVVFRWCQSRMSRSSTRVTPGSYRRRWRRAGRVSSACRLCPTSSSSVRHPRRVDQSLTPLWKYLRTTTPRPRRPSSSSSSGRREAASVRPRRRWSRGCPKVGSFWPIGRRRPDVGPVPSSDTRRCSPHHRRRVFRPPLMLTSSCSRYSRPVIKVRSTSDIRRRRTT